jgi:hypothetical protein
MVAKLKAMPSLKTILVDGKAVATGSGAAEQK